MKEIIRKYFTKENIKTVSYVVDKRYSCELLNNLKITSNRQINRLTCYLKKRKINLLPRKLVGSDSIKGNNSGILDFVVRGDFVIKDFDCIYI